MPAQRRYKLIACEILYREICFCAARSKNIVDIVFMPKGLHDVGETKMSARLQQEIDSTKPDTYSAILLAYALCNNGIRGLHSPIPLVIPRAHDCITLLLGSKERYGEYFPKNPGTFFKSTGWIERDSGCTTNGESVTSQLGMNAIYQEYVQIYGEENAGYLAETLGDWVKHYKKLAYIDMNIGEFAQYREQSRTEASERGWEFEEIAGDTGLIQRLLDGEWDRKEFLVVEPGQSVKVSYDEGIIAV